MTTRIMTRIVGIVPLVAATVLVAACGADESAVPPAADHTVSTSTSEPTAVETPSIESTEKAAEDTGGFPPQGACVLTVAIASQILGEPAEDEGYSPPHCTFSPRSVPGYGLPEYANVSEQGNPDQSVSEWRTGRRANGLECDQIVERPDLGPGAYEEYCPVTTEVGGGQTALLYLPSGQGHWTLSVELHSARMTSDSAAVDLLHETLSVLQAK